MIPRLCLSPGVDGQPIRINETPKDTGRKEGPQVAAKPAKANARKILSMKQYVWASGQVLQTDANYFAYRLLKESSTLTQAVIRRFPVIVVDEAQDMTEVQHALIDHLRAAGHQHIVLVGDEHQAIYEWNTARPQLFVDKATDQTPGKQWIRTTIAQTFRCSRPICALLDRLSADGTQITPATGGKNQAYNQPVAVAAYDDASEQADVRRAIDDMAARLDGENAHDGNRANVKTIAVLAHARENVARLQAFFTGEPPRDRVPVVWEAGETRDYLRVIYHLLRREVYAAANAYEALLLKLGGHATKADMRLTLAETWGLRRDSLADYRVAIFDDLTKMQASLPPSTAATIADCVKCCPTNLAGIATPVMTRIATECGSFAGAPKANQNRALLALFVEPDARSYFAHPSHDGVRLVFSTIHGVKGETYDGTLLYLRSRMRSCGCDPGKAAWAEILQHELVACEGKRVLYVAMSRAAQTLAILAPRSTEAVWRQLIASSVADQLPSTQQ